MHKMSNFRATVVASNISSVPQSSPPSRAASSRFAASCAPQSDPVFQQWHKQIRTQRLCTPTLLRSLAVDHLGLRMWENITPSLNDQIDNSRLQWKTCFPSLLCILPRLCGIEL